MQPREKIIIEASGQPGDHGFQYFGQRDGVAPAGRPGANGRSSCAATKGTDGKNIRVKLGYSDDKPGTVLITGTRGDNPGRWEVTNEQILLLDCKGGDGGNGGRGEDGQQGGEGARGRNATKYRDAQHGGIGARGGDGGYGTNGADGGNAGHAFIEIDEKDMDLLLPMYWDIRGGKGGGSGTHGDPGDGGIGGDGGDGISWTERYGDRVIERNRPRGSPGAQGPPGNRPAVYLSGGSAGVNGSSQITVFRADGTQATYPTRYELKVVSFDITDENLDGVNEPGEHLLVSNIKVENTGGMPSPKTPDIKVLIHGTHWLEPIESEPVFLPPNIKPGQIVQVPGVIKAFISHERSSRGPGQMLQATDEVQLIATATRLGRTLEGFSGKTQIVVKYPLELDAPKYLDCVEKGDEVTFSWVLRNVSTKPYGIEGSLRRDAGTILNDKGHYFEFIDACGKDKMVDLLEVLDPGTEVPISQTFRVSDRAFPYSEAHLELELMLSDPDSKVGSQSQPLSVKNSDYPHLRSIGWYGMRLQIAGTYSLNRNASFLMIVNAYTINTVINQAMRFIQNELGLAYDIFNISVNGSLVSPITGSIVLEDYEGKSIMLFTNSFPYFRRGSRTIFDFLDPQLVGRLSKASTGFSFLGPNESAEAAIKWSSMLGFLKVRPTPKDEDDGSIHSENMSQLNQLIYNAGAVQFNQSLPRHGFPSQKSMFSKPDSKLDKDAKLAAQKMMKTFPLRRFAIHGDPQSRTENCAGYVEIYEGLPMASKMRYSLQDFDANRDEIPDFNKFVIVASLPFAMRVEMMWNMMKSGGTVSGINTKELYNIKGIEPSKEIKISTTESREVSEQICRAIFLSVEHDLLHEFALFNQKVSWPDFLPGPDSLQQLPLTQHFFRIGNVMSDQISSTEGTNGFSQIMGTLRAALESTSFGQLCAQTILFGLGSRKAKLRPQLNLSIKTVLDTNFSPDAAKQAQETIKAQMKVVKAQLKASGSTRKGFEDRKQKLLQGFVMDGGSTTYHDLPLHNPTTRNTELLSTGAPQAKVREWEEFMKSVINDWAYAEELRKEMVTRDDR